MRSSQTITLFSERPELGRKSPSFAVSILVHGAVIALVAYGLLHPPPLRNRILDERLTVRNLELHLPEPARQHPASGSDSPSPYPNAKKIPEGVSSAQQEAVLRQATEAPVAHQTLLQPKLKNLLKLPQDIPLPTVVLWSPEQLPIKSIIPPPPVKLTAAQVLASPVLPNREARLADVRISATDLSQQKIPILPSTTSPVVVKGPELPQAVPTTSSVSSAQPTPTAVVSISDVRMTEGKVILPPANASSSDSAPGMLMQGQGNASARTNISTSPNGSGGTMTVGTGTGNAKGATAPAGAAANGTGAKIWPTPGNGTGNGNDTGTAKESDTDEGPAARPATTHITLPRTGQFSSVVVGVSLEDKYPETARLWGGRMAYTVYLHVGLAKSWIFQYSLPRSDDAASGGNTAHLEAPWAYNIVRPNIASEDLNADALIIHGFVNTDGRFEQLKIVFPPEFPQSRFVLDSLAQWEFRAALQGGQPKRVEVMLIIPDIE
jgi:hypothetical protein